MGFDSHANQGTEGQSGAGEGSDAPPGGYWPPVGANPPDPQSHPTVSWPSAPVSAPPPPPGPGWAGAPGYNPPAYSPSPPPSPMPYGGYSPPPPPGYGPPPAGPAGYGGYAGYPSYGYSGSAVPRTDGTAIAALVLALASFAVCPVVLAIISLAVIPGSRRTINFSGGTVGGLGLLTAAKIIAWINIGLFILVLGIVIIVAASSPSSDQTNALGYLVRL